MSGARPMAVGAALAVAVCFAASCKDPGGSAGSGGRGGAGGCPDGPPAPLFELVVSAAGGELPGDTTLRVKWSAGDEPVFKLDDPDTYKTLEDGSNVQCAVDRDAGAPHDLAQLTCELWTSGTTEISLTAAGYLAHDEALVPKLVEGCQHPVSSRVTVELQPDLDAGTAE